MKRNLLFSFENISLITTIAVFVLIVLGGMVRVSGAGGACPDWPTCFGQLTVPEQALQGSEKVLVDYLHRFMTGMATLLVGMTAILARRDRRHQPWILRPVFGAGLLMLVQIFLGALVARQEYHWGSELHLAFSLLTLACLLVPVVISRLHPAHSEDVHFAFRTPFTRLALITLILVFVLLVSGTLVSGIGNLDACQNWPLCNGMSLPITLAEWVHVVHRSLVLISGLSVSWLFISAWRRMRHQPVALVAATVVFVLYTSQALLGSQLVRGFPVYLLGLHQATSVALWAAAVILVATAGTKQLATADEIASIESLAGRRGLLRDLLLLTKPIVVLLLLVTTYAGMVIGAKDWPSMSLTFWTMLAGFMAAGGSGAINQYIDREDDVKMQRTQKRPIPAGRLTPAEGLAFGVGIALASFYLMVAFVNFLAALLSLAGTLYYVVLYSLVLKKTTVQNIVIGGGAGAIPPLVGWAAATGSLNIPSLFLFAVVFMWTPPHFWALALVRAKDYARAGVPMLPVIRGEIETRRQILIYTLELVGLTLLLPLFGLGGSTYFVGAAVLGGWLAMAAWKVWKQGGNKVAWKMYRYSSMYLAFLFVVLMVDALL